MHKDFVVGDTENPQLYLTIIDIVERWKRKYPDEWELVRNGNEQVRSEQARSDAIAPDGSVQFAMRIPKRVLQQIDFVAKDPAKAGQDILNDDAVWKFLKKQFPEFMIPA